MILFIMSLHNLKEHPYLILSPLINEATSFRTDNIDFLDEEIVEIQGSRFEQRTREEEEAYLNFLRNFEREISGSSADTNNLRITIPPKKTMTIGLPTNVSERSHLQMKNKRVKSDNLVN